MARRRKKKSNAGKFFGLILTVLVAGAAGWFFSQTPERQLVLRARAEELWRAFQKLIEPPGSPDDPLEGIVAQRPDITEAEAVASRERTVAAQAETQALEQVPGLDLKQLRFVAGARFQAGEQQMALRTWPLAHAYYEAATEIHERILKTDKAALESFNRRRAALALRDPLERKRHPGVKAARWEAAESRLAEGMKAFDGGDFIAAAKAFQDAAVSYGEIQGISDQLYRYDQVKSEFVLALGKTNPEMMGSYGGELWKEILALQAQGAALDYDSPSGGVAAFEQALKRLPEAVKLARKARALEVYTTGMRAAEAAMAAADLPGATEAYRAALASEHDQLAPALSGFAAAVARVGPPSGQRVTLLLEDGQPMEFALLPPGTFRMGDANGDADARPARDVTLARPFLLACTETTQAQWQALMARDPSRAPGPGLPVTNVLWAEAVAYAARFSALRGLTLRLPAEAEWEYACRAGSAQAYGFGSDPALLPLHANFCDEACATRVTGEARRDGFADLAPVGSFKPNAWNLLDMHGNAMEWCVDVYHPEGYRMAAEGRSPAAGADAFRCVRGGSYNYPGTLAASARRYRYLENVTTDSIGFRLALDVP